MTKWLTQHTHTHILTGVRRYFILVLTCVFLVIMNVVHLLKSMSLEKFYSGLQAILKSGCLFYCWWGMCVHVVSHVWLWLHGLRCPWYFLGKNTGVSSHFLLQGILPTQGSNMSFLCLFITVPPGKPIGVWVLYIFLNINSLLEIPFANIFFNSVGCLFILLMASFVQKLLSLTR